MSQNLITEEKVFEELKKAIVETLRVDESSIKLESSLINDLGAESLDFLDINYRLEQAFGMKMARHFVLEHIEEMFGEGTAINEDGQLTDKAVELLKIRFGGNMPQLKSGMDMDEIPSMVTVQSMVQGVMDILASLPEKCSNCGNSAWQSDDGSKIKCGSCGEGATFTNGDDLIKAWLTKVQAEKNIF
ncbi:MAG: phosphopantetheine-binding protein [Nitrospirota bacterium]